MASEIVEAASGPDKLGLVGIRRGGVPLANRLAAAIQESDDCQVPVGTVEIAFHRDDAATAPLDPTVGPSEVPFDVSGKDVVLVDDVLQTGRTARAAMGCLLDYGRSRRVWLAVLCDRGGRELPIAADFVGRQVEVPVGGLLDVRLGGPTDEVVLTRRR